MRSIRVQLLVVATVVVSLLVAAPVAAQSSKRVKIADGDVWTITDEGIGGFAEMIIAWIKKADFDILIEAEVDNDTFVVCRGQSYQEAFERCAFGQGASTYYMTIYQFSGARSSKGGIWISFTDETRRFNRAGVAGDFALTYYGNIGQPGDDPVLAQLAEDVEEQKRLKSSLQR